MPEILEYKPQPYESMPDWDAVFERIKALQIPETVHDRADDVARNFTTGKDIEMFGKALHDVIVPDIESMPVDRAMKIKSPDGEVKYILLQPEERTGLYDEAAEYLKQLNMIRVKTRNDEEFLRRASNVVGLALVGAHAYANGNGRTSRTLAELIRHGAKNKSDLILSATERDISQQHLNGIRPYSYKPRQESVDRGGSIHDTLRAAASLDIPFDDQESYQKRAYQAFETPFGPEV